MSNLDKAHEHIKQALDQLNPVGSNDIALTLAIVAAAYTNLATLDYIKERDQKPFDEATRLIELGIAIEKGAANDDSNNARDFIRGMEGRDSKP